MTSRGSWWEFPATEIVETIAAVACTDDVIIRYPESVFSARCEHLERVLSSEVAIDVPTITTPSFGIISEVRNRSRGDPPPASTMLLFLCGFHGLSLDFVWLQNVSSVLLYSRMKWRKVRGQASLHP